MDWTFYYGLRKKLDFLNDFLNHQNVVAPSIPNKLYVNILVAMATDGSNDKPPSMQQSKIISILLIYPDNVLTFFLSIVLLFLSDFLC
jgi:hypothetical protein